MGLFNKNRVRTEGEKMPAFIDAQCLGDQCPNWGGEACSSQFEWISAKATVTENRDTSEPPFIDEANYVIYGQSCGQNPEGKPVTQRVEVINPEGVSMMALIALTGRYGEMPVSINQAGQTNSIITIASSKRAQEF
jgi:hypothetical protein